MLNGLPLMKTCLVSALLLLLAEPLLARPPADSLKTRVIVTSDGEVDDECSLVRFLLYANEWDVEGIVTSSSQYHARDHSWVGDDWTEPYLDAYEKIYPNLVKHDEDYPSPAYLRERTVLGNVDTEGDMDEDTPGSELIVRVLLDESDDRPVWVQAWGGTNTIARALKTIEEEHPDKMAYVAGKIRFFFIWEQDATYQDYIRPRWGKYDILTIISDQFWAVAYEWDEILPPKTQQYFTGDWMKQHILEDHGALASLYKAHEPGSHGLSGDTDFEDGDFRSEGDSPAFLHVIPTGLANQTHPDWGGWGGRYVRVRDNTWLDPVPESGYEHPEGRWYTETAWGRLAMREGGKDITLLMEYFKPIWRWADTFQRDFAARADWSVKSYEEANHPPAVELGHAAHLTVRPGSTVELSAQGTSDPDGDALTYRWWPYREAGSYDGTIEIQNAGKQEASFTPPGDVSKGETIHVICEVTDTGTPQLTRYERVVVEVE